MITEFEEVEILHQLSEQLHRIANPEEVAEIHPDQRFLGRSSTESVDVPIFDVDASMGRGASLPEHEAVVDHMRLTKSWIQRNIPSLSNPNNLAVLSAYGDSMTPTFSDGDILLVDRGISDIKIDAVYVLALQDELYVKRLQRRPGGAVLMISDNKAYEPYVIDNGERQHFRVLGRVVWAWNGRKL